MGTRGEGAARLTPTKSSEIASCRRLEVGAAVSGRIIALRRSNIVHLRRPWRAGKAADARRGRAVAGDFLASGAMGRGSVKRFRRPGSHETIVRLDEATFSCRENKLTSMADIKARRSSDGVYRSRQVDSFGNRGDIMKRPLLTVAIVVLACAATLLPTRSTPPMLLSNADWIEWKCSKSVLILTTCAPKREIRLSSLN